MNTLPAHRALTAYERARLGKGRSWKEGKSRILRETELFSEENNHYLRGLCAFLCIEVSVLNLPKFELFSLPFRKMTHKKNHFGY